MISFSLTRNVVRSQRCAALTKSFFLTAPIKNEVRLSKRMSELGICSRREAARILKEASECSNEAALKYLKDVIYIRGRPVTGGTGVKVAPDEKCIEIRAGEASAEENNSSDLKEYVPYAERQWPEICVDSIVLNKPIGYVSGQEEHQHVPAVRLLTRSNHLNTDDDDAGMLSSLQFTKRRRTGSGVKTSSSVPKHIRNKLNEDGKRTVDKEMEDNEWEATLSGYAVAGRLDIDSTGLVIFTRSGIMAKRLISPDSTIRKEYVVKVTPAVQLSAREIEIGMKRLPRPTTDLDPLLKGGRRLWNEAKPLKPVIEAEWLNIDSEEEKQRQIRTLRLVLQEGKKRQIRRMCRELLGLHVVDLVRTAIGPVKIESLPEGKWRTLTKEEVEGIFKVTPKMKKSTKKRKGNFE